MKRPLLLTLGLGAAIVGILAYGLASPEATLLGPSLARTVGPRQVSLTFDDGPSTPFTSEVLDILRDAHVRATFFICGANAERYPELVRRIQAEGHEIGNHTYSHPYLYLMNRERIAAEIDRTQDLLERISGRRPRLFRPPFGVRWFSLGPILRERGMAMVMWSVRGYDSSLDERRIAEGILGRLHPGAIIVLHDGFETNSPDKVDRSATVKALPAIISGVRKAGYAFAPIPQGLRTY